VTGPHTSPYDGNARTVTRMRPEKPTALPTTERYAATGQGRADVGVGDPEVERGRGRLEGEADEGEGDARLREGLRTGRRRGLEPRRRSRVRCRLPVDDVHEADAHAGITAVAVTEERKNFSAASEESRSPRLIPTRAKAGREATSRATTRVARSRAAGSRAAPAAEESSRNQYSPTGSFLFVSLRVVSERSAVEQGSAEHQQLDDQREMIGGVAAHSGVGGEAETWSGRRGAGATRHDQRRPRGRRW
jgi:hypothetical protein